MRTVEASQHVLLEAQSDVSQTPRTEDVVRPADVSSAVTETAVSVDRAVRMTDVSVSYVCKRSVDDERLTGVVPSDKYVSPVPALIEASTKSVQMAVPTIDQSSGVFGPSPSESGHCSLCGQRVKAVGLAVVDDAVQTEYAEDLSGVSAGDAALHPSAAKDGSSFVTIRRTDGTCETRRVIGYYVDASGEVVGLRVSGLEDRDTIGIPRVDIASPTDRDLRPVESGVVEQVVHRPMVDTWGSSSSAEWIDTLVAVQPGAVGVKGFGVQTEVGVRGEPVRPTVDEMSMSVSTSVGEYGPVVVSTPTKEVEPEERAREVTDTYEHVPVPKLVKVQSASVQADLVCMRTVEASQHVLLEAQSDVSQTPKTEDVMRPIDVSATVGKVTVPLDRGTKLLDVCVSYITSDDTFISTDISQTPSAIKRTDLEPIVDNRTVSTETETLSICETWIQTAEQVEERAVKLLERSPSDVCEKVTEGRTAEDTTTAGTISAEERKERVKQFEEKNTQTIAAELEFREDTTIEGRTEEHEAKAEVRDWQKPRSSKGEAVIMFSSEKRSFAVQTPSLDATYVHASQHLLMKAQRDLSAAPIFEEVGLPSQESSLSKRSPLLVDDFGSMIAALSFPSEEPAFDGSDSHHLVPGVPQVVDAFSMYLEFDRRDMSVPVLCVSEVFTSSFAADSIPSSVVCGESSLVDSGSSYLLCSRCGTSLRAEAYREGDSLPAIDLTEWSVFDHHLSLHSRDAVTTIDRDLSQSHLRSVQWEPPVFRKTCATQFSFTPDVTDVFCQISSTYIDEETETSDLAITPTVLVQNNSITDYRERLIEHYYYAPPRDASLVADVEIQAVVTDTERGVWTSRLTELSEAEIIEVKKTVERFYNLGAYQRDLHSGNIVEKACSTEVSLQQIIPQQEGAIVGAAVPHQPQSGPIDIMPIRESRDVAIQWKSPLEIYEIAETFNETEIWKSLRVLTSTYDSYQARKDSGFVREQGAYAHPEEKMVADMGIQVSTTSDPVEVIRESPDLRSASPISNLDVSEHYQLRKRMGQISEEHCLAVPLVYSDATQTEDIPLHFAHEFDTLNRFSETFEIYHHRLLRDQVAEAWTQWDKDVEEEIMELDGGSLSEEQILEVRQKKRKRIVSQVQITEELAEEPGLMVCELGIQTESSLSDKESQELLLDRDPFSSTLDKSLYLRATQAVQTSPITLKSILYSDDWSWADKDLQTVLMKGLQAKEELDLPSMTPVSTFEQSSPKLLASIGCQTGIIRPVLMEGELLDHRSQITDDELFVRPLYPESTNLMAETSSPPIIVQLRQRTIQYELLESRTRSGEDEWNNIREVASPQTGHFAPVAMAIRSGWIRLGEENVYVDPETNISIPLSKAYEMGRIRLSSPYDARRSQSSIPILLLIERVYHVWRKTQLVNVVDTARGLAMTPEAALQAGILETTEDEIRYLDTLNNTWITIEEGVGRQIIQTDEVDNLSDSISEDNDEPAICRVFRLTQLCPGGEPSPWMSPIEANRLGLFRWETGDVAADWPARPQLRYEDLMGVRPPEAFVPTKWCSFLTAKHAGWLRLTEEEEPSRWITTATSHMQEKNSVLLSTQIKLLAHTSSPIHSYGNQLEIGAAHRMPESTDVYSSGDTDLRHLYYPRQLPNSGRMISTHRVCSYEQDEQSYHEETSDNLYSESLSERHMFDSSQEPYYHTDVYDSS